MAPSTYLPIFNKDGSWINRPDLFLLARMGAEDQCEPSEIYQIYKTMLSSDEASANLNRFEADIEKRFLRHDLRLRHYCGEVVLEAVRIFEETRECPSSNQAIKLVAFNSHEHSQRSSPEQLEREVRRGFASYRNTAHLQAAYLIMTFQGQSIELSEDNTLHFLGLARKFERFIDTCFTHQDFRWTPWRIPECVEEIGEMEFLRLTPEEKRVAGIKG